MRGGREAEIAVHDVAVGDVVLVRPGEKIPVDGEVTDGAGAVEARVTLELPALGLTHVVEEQLDLG